MVGMGIGKENPMLYAPTFQDCALVTDDVLLAAQVSTLYSSSGTPFPGSGWATARA